MPDAFSNLNSKEMRRSKVLVQIESGMSGTDGERTLSKVLQGL